MPTSPDDERWFTCYGRFAPVPGSRADSSRQCCSGLRRASGFGISATPFADPTSIPKGLTTLADLSVVTWRGIQSE